MFSPRSYYFPTIKTHALNNSYQWRFNNAPIGTPTCNAHNKHRSEWHVLQTTYTSCKNQTTGVGNFVLKNVVKILISVQHITLIILISLIVLVRKRHVTFLDLSSEISNEIYQIFFKLSELLIMLDY